MRTSRKMNVSNFIIVLSMVYSYALLFLILYELLSYSYKVSLTTILMALPVLWVSAIYLYKCNRKYVYETSIGIKIPINISLSKRYPLIRNVVILSAVMCYFIIIVIGSSTEKTVFSRETMTLLIGSILQFAISIALLKLKSWIGGHTTNN